MLEAEKEFECQNNRCRCRFKVKADIEQGGIMELPVLVHSFSPTDQMSVEWFARQMQVDCFQTRGGASFPARSI